MGKLARCKTTTVLNYTRGMLVTKNGNGKNMGRIEMQQVAANRKGPVSWCLTVFVFGPGGNLSYYRHSQESV